jgi:hypothetical protein
MLINLVIGVVTIVTLIGLLLVNYQSRDRLEKIVELLEKK